MDQKKALDLLDPEKLVFWGQVSDLFVLHGFEA